MAKRCLLDGLGVSLAATGLAPVCRPFIEYAVEQGGRSESIVFGTSTRAPAASGPEVLRGSVELELSRARTPE